MRFAKERYTQALIAEMMPLWEAHHSEAANKFYGPLDPDLGMYEHCDAAGMLRIFTARIGGKISGYQIFLVTVHPHSRDWITATQDILYVSPDYRRGMVGYQFIRWCVRQLQQEGIRVVHQMVPERMKMGRLFERLGYKREDVCYSKLLQGVF